MKRKCRGLRVLLFLLLFLVLPLSPKSQAATVKPQKLKISATREYLLAGKKVTLKVTAVTPAKASKSVVWKSSNPKIASVNKKGQVTARKPGTAKITATSKINKKVKAVCTVKVYKKGTAPFSLGLNQKKITLIKGKSAVLKVNRVRPIGSSGKVKWSSSNKKVAVVTAKGKVVSADAGLTETGCSERISGCPLFCRYRRNYLRGGD